MAAKYTTRTLSLIVLPENDSLFSEMATEIKIEDEAGGEFVSVSQYAGHGTGKILIDKAEWPPIRDAIERMLAECMSPGDHS